MVLKGSWWYLKILLSQKLTFTLHPNLSYVNVMISLRFSEDHRGLSDFGF